MQWIVTDDKEWFDKWNQFVLKDEKSSFLQITHRLNAYKKYNMSWELLLYIDEDANIIMGAASVIVKFSFLKMYICSYGPTSLEISSTSFDVFIKKFKERAQEIGAFVAQITCYQGYEVDKCHNPKTEKIFDSVPTSKYENIINLKKENGESFSEDELISSFLKKGRRDVRASLRKGLSCRLIEDNKELQSAYACIEDNASNKGYSVRDWDKVSDFIYEGVEDGKVYVLTAWYKEKIQGTVILERSANKLSYTMGGVYRHKPDLLTGYFLQLNAMYLAQKFKLPLYDISFGGPKEVQRFKGMFNPQLVENYSTYHFVFSKLKYSIYKLMYKSIKSYLYKIIKLRDRLIK